tara:strand:+ start:88 stop:1200 length:1113 start_codon:yes stop_codon:yes gene_type:complete
MKQNGSMKEQMEGIAIAITPVKIKKEKRKKKAKGGKANKGIEALRKEAPEVVARMGYKEGSEVKVDDKILIPDSERSQIFKSMEDWKKGTDPNWNTLSQDSEGNIYVDYSVKETLPSFKEKFSDTVEDVKRFLKRDFKKEEIEFILNAEKVIEQDKIDQEKRKEYEKNFPQIEKERLARGNFYEGEEGYKATFAEGGDVDSQMAMMMPMEEAMSEEPEVDMIPDEQMEDEYLDFIISQSLSSEEEMELMNKLEADPELSVMFDKLMDTATEFSGSGPVDGPGSEVSDSIPARLSDGEFVFTAKATEQVGADRLQSMMEDAEAEADATRQQSAEGGEIEETKVDRFGKPVDEDIAEDEIKKGMMSVNPRMQ